MIADTHLPRGARRLPDACLERLRAADVIVHAGDFVRAPVLRELQSYGRVIAVHGNVDDAELRAVLPAAALVSAEGVRLAVVHDAGPSAGRLERMRARFPDASAVIFGHSHIPLHERSKDGFQIFNPGSPTERRRAPRHTMGWAEVRGGHVEFALLSLSDG